MKIYHDTLPQPQGIAIALGFFDGLHRGHINVIKSAAEQKSNGLLPAVFTFNKKPQAILSGKPAPRLIDREYRNELLERLGIEILYEIDFNSIKNTSADDFVENLLYKKLGAKSVFCGFNYHFGKSGTGNERTLHNLCSKYGISTFTLPPVTFNNEAISSTRIRLALISGDIKSANTMLGRYFSFDFTVCHGNRLGHKMKTPTINQMFPEDFILPKFGVYASYASFGGKTMPAVTNIGIKPTVGSDAPLAETWVLDSNIGKLYGESPRIELVEFIRPEKKFPGIQELQNSIFEDGKKAKSILNVN